MSSDGDFDDRRETVARRIDFLELLAEAGPLATREVVDALEYSRSTVVRAFGELREADLVRKTDDGYEVTVAGAMASEEYRRHERTTEAILATRDLLAPIPTSEAPPAAFLVGAETVRADDGGPVRAFEAVSERVRTADAVRAYLPTLVDTHLLRAWHDGVADRGAEGRAVVDPDLLPALKAQYPRLLSEMAAAAFSAVDGPGDGPPYALFLTEHDGERTASLVVYDGDAAVRGVVSNGGDRAVEWARETLDRLWTDGSDVTAELDALSGAVGGETDVHGRSAGDTTAGAAGDALPLALETEGFVRLSPDYFEDRDPASPEVSWRTGFTLPEVRAGHAVERRTESGRPLTDRVVEQLRDGDAAVVGPPGSGKSTVCRSVACDWYERGLGPVLYRATAEGDPLDSTALLEAYLRRTAGHALVVVEDCTRDGADAVFETLDVLADDDRVSFLLESRADRWDADDALGADTDADPRESIERVGVPAIDRATCERLAARFASLVDESVDVDGEELWSVVAEGASGDHEFGDLLAAQHHLVRRLDPLETPDGPAATALEADARRTYRDLAEADPDLALELAGVACLCSAAGVPVAPEYLYAAAPEGSLDAVDDALAALGGSVLFDPERSLGRDPTYRTRHDVWATAFLSAVVDETAPPRIEGAVADCLDRLLALGDRPERRERVAERLDGQTPHLHRVDADPQGWTDSVAERLFGLGRENASLSSLFAAESGIDVPETCSEAARIRCVYRRGQLLQQSGPVEAAVAVFERLASLAESASIDAAAAERWRARAHCSLGTLESWRGDLERADDHLQAALRAARAAEDRVTVADALLDLGNVAYWRGDHGAAREYYRECLDVAREADDRVTVGRALTGLGAAAQEQGDLSAAAEYQREALDVSVEAEDRSNEAEAAGHLGDVTRERGNLDAAATWYRREFEVASEIGRRRSEADALRNLARVARARGDVETARDYARRAVETARQTGETAAVGRALALLGEVECARNPVDAAERARAALDEFEVVDDAAGRSRCRRLLARSALERGAPADAVRHIDRAADIAEVADDRAGAACTAVRARVAAADGDYETARRLAEAAIDALDGFAWSPTRTDALVALAEVRVDSGEAPSISDALADLADERDIDLDGLPTVPSERTTH